MTLIERLKTDPRNDPWDSDLQDKIIAHIERMEMALRDAQRQFLFYERNHRAKIGNMATIVETQATVAKADANKMMADLCAAALNGDADPRAKLWTALRTIKNAAAIDGRAQDEAGKYAQRLHTFVTAALDGAPDAPE